MLADLSRCVPQDISNALWAFATMRHHCGNALLGGCATVSARIMARFKPQEIANTLWRAAAPAPGLCYAFAPCGGGGDAPDACHGLVACESAACWLPRRRAACGHAVRRARGRYIPLLLSHLHRRWCGLPVVARLRIL